MNILKIFTVYDSKAEAYMQPFYAQSRGAAIRMFTDVVNTKDHQFNKYSEDFTLFELGTFCDSNCEFNILPAPASVVRAIELKRVVEPFQFSERSDVSAS